MTSRVAAAIDAAKADGAAPSSATCRSATPTCRRASTRPSPWRRTAPTSSSSARPTPTRSWTVSSSRRPRRPRWRRVSGCATPSPRCARSPTAPTCRSS
jgi:hypothetical protein